MTGNKSKGNNLSLWVSVADMTLIYELLHDVKITYVKLSPEDKSKESAQTVIESCNRIMKKIEYKLLGAPHEKKDETE